MNFVMQAVLPPVTWDSILQILKIDWYIFVLLVLVFLLMGIILAILGIQKANREKHMREAIGKVLLEILPPTGGSIPIEWELCPYHVNEAKTINDTSRGTFSSPQWAEAPKGHSVDSYLLPDEHDYCTGWPIKSPAREQVIVPVYIVHKNFPWPECPHDAAKWDTDKIIKRSSAMFNQAKNETTMQALMSPQMAFAEQLRMLVEKFKWVIIGAIAAGAAAVLSLINIAIIILMVQGRIDAIAKFLTGK